MSKYLSQDLSKLINVPQFIQNVQVIQVLMQADIAGGGALI